MEERDPEWVCLEIRAGQEGGGVSAWERSRARGQQETFMIDLHFPAGTSRIRKLSHLQEYELREAEWGTGHLEARLCLHNRGILIPAELTLHGGMKPTSGDLGQINCNNIYPIFIQSLL